MRAQFLKISLIILVLLGLVLPNGLLYRASGQLSANDLEVTQEVSESLQPELLIPGRIERTGTYFEIKDSEYLNISLQSSEEITIVLESIPRMISIDISSSTDSTSTVLVISGLELNEIYYKYQDSYKNEAVFISDEKGSYSWNQDLTQPHHIWFQEIKSTVFLPEDCSEYGTWNETTKTCTLNQDLTQSVEIIENNITLDCNGHRITTLTNGHATGGAYGIYLNNKEGVVVKGCNIDHFTSNIYLNNSIKNSIVDNDISYTYWAIRVQNSSNNNTITNNNITSTYDSGIWLWRSSSNNFVANNTISKWEGSSAYRGGLRIEDNSSKNNIENNIFINDGIIVRNSYQNTIENNVVNGKPIIYLEEKSDYVVPSGAGQVILVNSSNITVKNLDLSGTIVPIQLLKTTNSRVENNNVTASGISLYYSGLFMPLGIYVEDSTNNYISRNNGGGICLVGSSNNTIETNNLPNITLYGSSLNNIVSNKIGAGLGLYLYSSSNNLITNNIFVGSGLFIEYSTKNTVENNIVNNKPLVYLENVSGYTVSNAGQVILVNCNNITIENLKFLTTNGAIQLYRTKNSKISNNNIAPQRWSGAILLTYSSGNLISKNTINVGGATIVGIQLRDSSNNNIISDNYISYAGYGITLLNASNNKIYHNNFIHSSAYAYYGIGNFFDNGYPSGGNYWSNYTGVDLYSGPNQDQAGSDGIGDTPYTFTGGQDRHPFMKENGWEAPSPPINQPSVAEFTYSPQNPIKNEIVTFDASISSDPDGSIIKHEWDFGDGTNGTGEIATHSYSSIGDYNVKLTVIDDGGATDSISKIIQVFSHKVVYIPVRYIGDPEPMHSITELKQRAKLVADYYRQQSYMAVRIGYEFVFNEWKSLGKSLADYPEGSDWWEKWEAIREEAINLSGIDINDYDSVIVIQPACMTSFANDLGGKKIITTDKEPFGVWAHELGHTIFKFYDYYEKPGYEWSQGDIHYWGLMGAATLMNPTAPIMSYNKERADWLEYITIPSEEYGEYPINLLKDLSYGDDVYRYNIISGSTEYYIFEGRYPKDDIAEDPQVPPCSISLPYHICLSGGYCGTHYKYELSEDEGILLYKVTREVNPYTGEPKIFTIPHPIRFWPDAVNKVTLTPGKTYIDDEAEVKFTAKEQDSQLYVDISEHIPFWRKIISLSDTSWTIPEFILPGAVPSQWYFDIDLRAYTYDGKKIGMDYTSMEYLLPDDIRTSGNIPGGGPEWISVPRDTNIYYMIDATPAREWAEELNLTIEDLQATWQVVYYDENSVRRESEPITIEINLEEPTILAIQANIDINPDTLNLRSKGKWITAYIELPEGYDVSQIDINTVMLNYIVSAENDPKYGFVKSFESRIGDYDRDGISDLMVKFDRAMVQELLQDAEGVVELIITGEVIYNKVPILFQGTDIIKIMPK